MREALATELSAHSSTKWKNIAPQIHPLNLVSLILYLLKLWLLNQEMLRPRVSSEARAQALQNNIVTENATETQSSSNNLSWEELVSYCRSSSLLCESTTESISLYKLHGVSPAGSIFYPYYELFLRSKRTGVISR